MIYEPIGTLERVLTSDAFVSLERSAEPVDRIYGGEARRYRLVMRIGPPGEATTFYGATSTEVCVQAILAMRNADDVPRCGRAFRPYLICRLPAGHDGSCRYTPEPFIGPREDLPVFDEGDDGS